jgi:chloramphenicol 3-O-phosphotransferase
VILTGASGAGKTSVAQAIEALGTAILVYQGDRIGLPSDEIMAGYGHTEEPGGPIQRGFALYWLGIIADQLKAGRPVLLETQCRIAFLREALSLHNITDARIILMECSDESRQTRLRARGQAELANDQMSNWSRFLHAEAENFGLEIVDTTDLSLDESLAQVLKYFDSPARLVQRQRKHEKDHS